MAQAPTAASATANLGNIINLLQNMFLGQKSGGTEATTGASSRTGTGSETVNTSTSSLPEVIQALFGMMNTANNNAANPAAVQPVLSDISRRALTAFAPQLGREASAGLYNSTTRKQLAGQSAADTASAMASAVLQYITQQQQIGANVGNTLSNASKSTSGTTDRAENVATTNTANTTSTKKIDPGLGGLADPLGLGLLGYGLFKSKDKLLDTITGLFGSGGGAGSPASAISVDSLAGISPNFYEDVLSPLNFLSTSSPAAVAGTPADSINLFDSVLSPTDGGLDLGSFINVAGDGGDILSAISDLGNLDISGGITDFLGGAGSFFDDLWSSVSGLFSF